MEGGFLGGGANLFDHLGGGPRMRFRREAEEDGGGVIESIKSAEQDVEDAVVNAEHELEEALAPVAETVGMEPW